MATAIGRVLLPPDGKRYRLINFLMLLQIKHYGLGLSRSVSRRVENGYFGEQITYMW